MDVTKNNSLSENRSRQRTNITTEPDRSEIINRRYRIIKHLGQGSRGHVFLVEDTLDNNRRLSLKRINPNVLNQNALKRFKQEFEIMTRLKHTNLIRVFDFGFDPIGKTYYITMEYIDGPSLRNVLADHHGPLAEDCVLIILVDLCRALSFMHSRNIVHRDIKPSNIMFTSDGVVKLMDFGLADLNTSNMQKKGTILYMAPEIFMENIMEKNRHQLDIFALGMTAYELLTDSIFYTNFTTQQCVSLLLHEEQFQKHHTHIGEKITNRLLGRIITKMTAFHTTERYENSVQIIGDINQLIGKDYPLETDKTREAYVLGAGFIGRDKEMTILTEKLQRREKSPRVLWIQGDAGIGKSRLFQEFKIWCQIHDIPFYEGTCTEHIQTQFGPFLPIISELLLFAREDSIVTYGPDLKKLLPDHPVLKSITPNTVYDPQTEHFMLVNALVESLIAMTESSAMKCVIYLNDMQWSDEGSMEVCKALLEKMNIRSTSTDNQDKWIQVYLSSRVHGIEHIKKFAQHHKVEELPLMPFNREEVYGYLESVFGTLYLGQYLKNAVGAINNKVGGNPFFLQELIISMITNQVIIRTTGSWELSEPLENAKIPANLNELISQRLRNLHISTHEWEILRIMVLLNRFISWEDLNRIIPTDFNFINRLEKYEILKSEIRDDYYGYCIAHDLIAGSIAKTIKEKKRLHRIIADRLETIITADLDTCAEELAHHFHQANIPEKAILYLDRAAGNARTKFENSKALSFLEIILSLLDENAYNKRADTLLQRAWIFWTLGNYSQAIESFRIAGIVAEYTKDYAKAAEAYWMCSHNLIETFDKSCAIIAQKALDFAELAKDKKMIARSLNVLGLYYWDYGKDYEKGIEYHQRGIKIANEINDSYGEAINRGNMGNALYALGRLEDAINSEEAGVNVYGEIPEFQRDKAYGLGSLGTKYAHIGNYEKAFRYFDKSIILCDKVGCFGIKAETYVRKAEAHFTRQMFSDAKYFSDLAEEHLDKSSSGFYFQNQVLKAKITYALGNRKKGKEKLFDLSKTVQDKYALAEIYYQLWCMDKEESYRNEACKLYEELVQLTSHYIYKKRLHNLEVNQQDYKYPHQRSPRAMSLQRTRLQGLGFRR